LEDGRYPGDGEGRKKKRDSAVSSVRCSTEKPVREGEPQDRDDLRLDDEGKKHATRTPNILFDRSYEERGKRRRGRGGQEAPHGPGQGKEEKRKKARGVGSKAFASQVESRNWNTGRTPSTEKKGCR